VSGLQSSLTVSSSTARQRLALEHCLQCKRLPKALCIGTCPQYATSKGASRQSGQTWLQKWSHTCSANISLYQSSPHQSLARCSSQTFPGRNCQSPASHSQYCQSYTDHTHTARLHQSQTQLRPHTAMLNQSQTQLRPHTAVHNQSQTTHTHTHNTALPITDPARTTHSYAQPITDHTHTAVLTLTLTSYTLTLTQAISMHSSLPDPPWYVQIEKPEVATCCLAARRGLKHSTRSPGRGNSRSLMRSPSVASLPASPHWWVPCTASCQSSLTLPASLSPTAQSPAYLLYASIFSHDLVSMFQRKKTIQIKNFPVFSDVLSVALLMTL